MKSLALASAAFFIKKVGPSFFLGPHWFLILSRWMYLEKELSTSIALVVVSMYGIQITMFHGRVIFLANRLSTQAIRYGTSTLLFQHLASPEAFADNPSLVWEFYHYRREVMATKDPNKVL